MKVSPYEEIPLSIVVISSVAHIHFETLIKSYEFVGKLQGLPGPRSSRLKEPSLISYLFLENFGAELVGVQFLVFQLPRNTFKAARWIVPRLIDYLLISIIIIENCFITS
jgi:hypothetical protein